MKWYWIVLIVLAAVAVGMIVAKMIKPKASSPANNASTTPVVVAPKSTEQVEINTVDNTADNTRTIVARKVA